MKRKKKVLWIESMVYEKKKKNVKQTWILRKRYFSIIFPSHREKKLFKYNRFPLIDVFNFPAFIKTHKLIS